MNEKDLDKNAELNDWIDALDNLLLFNGKENAANIILESIGYNVISEAPGNSTWGHKRGHRHHGLRGNSRGSRR